MEKKNPFDIGAPILLYNGIWTDEDKPLEIRRVYVVFCQRCHKPTRHRVTEVDGLLRKRCTSCLKLSPMTIVQVDAEEYGL